MEIIGLERDGDVLIVTIDHPDSALNAVDARLHRELAELFRDAQAGVDRPGGRAHGDRQGVLGGRRHVVVPRSCARRRRRTLCGARASS